MRDPTRVNVRALAEFYAEGGDLVYAGGGAERMQEGMRGHQALQSAYSPEWQSEVSLSAGLEAEGVVLALYGRADGLTLAENPPVIEEIKTTHRPCAEIGPEDWPAHWIQAELYGFMLARREDLSAVELRLLYLNLSGGKITFTRTFTRAELEERAARYAAPYARWLAAMARWREKSRPTMASLPFPFDGYRPGQREMAANVYVALRDGRRLLCQAPTGIGKTAAALYPALKALGEGRVDRAFYLTARTTGQQAALDALQRMEGKGLVARRAVLSAREKMCIRPGQICSPESCPRARGYYDRRRAALYEALDMTLLDAPAIRALAEKYDLCPFELSLDLSETADVVICDYNYAFDPRVRLQRFFLNRSDAGLLVDEAHHLASRARDMLSASLSGRALRLLRAHVGSASGRRHALYRALTPLVNAFKVLRQACDGKEAISAEVPGDVIDAARSCLSAMGEQLDAAAPWREELRERFFETMDFLRCAGSYGEDFRTLLFAEGKEAVRATLWCVNPAPFLDKALGRVHGAALFSATLSPISFYRDITGLSEEAGDAALSLASPFPPENLLVLRIPLPVRYRQREGSLPELARLIVAFVSARVGNYMIFFPSYAYLNRAREALAPLLPPGIRLTAQEGDMDDEARASFLAAFEPAPERTLAALAVLGGSFSEGIDLMGDRLTGAMVVGTGVPQIGADGDALREVYARRFGEGYRYAYMYPGAARVLQAAGRVIRSEKDRGAVALVDSRWMDGEHLNLLPPHWRVETVRDSEALSRRLGEFWREKGEDMSP